MTAIQNAGRDDIRIITGFGGAHSAFDIYQLEDENEIFRATMSYFPTMGAEGIRMAVRFLQGENIPRDTFEPSIVINMHNWREFIQYAY